MNHPNRMCLSFALLALGLASPGCSDSSTDGEDPSMGAPTNGDPSASATAMTPSTTVETACTSGPETEPPSCAYSKGECAQRQCPGAEGIPAEPSPFSAFSVTLRVPVVAGEPYVASVLVNHATTMVEVWGTNSECGSTDELLGSAPVTMRDEITCMVLSPTRAYSHLLVITRGSAGLGIFGLSNRQFCPMDSCPLPE